MTIVDAEIDENAASALTTSGNRMKRWPGYIASAKLTSIISAM